MELLTVYRKNVERVGMLKGEVSNLKEHIHELTEMANDSDLEEHKDKIKMIIIILELKLKGLYVHIIDHMEKVAFYEKQLKRRLQSK